MKEHSICYENCSSWAEIQCHMNFLNHCDIRGSQANMQGILSMSSESLKNLVKMKDKIAEVQCDSIGMCAIG